LQNSPKNEATEQVAPSTQPAPINNAQNNPVDSSQSNSTVNTASPNVENSQIQEFTQSDIDLVDPGKTSDVERTFLVKSMEGSVSSNLDFLVDEQWADTVTKYKKFYRVLFKWGCLALASIT
jgi:hypothetical protein